MERGTPAAQQLAAKGAEITHSQQSGSGVRMRRLDGSGLFALVRGRPGCARTVCQVQM
jgi:hypothetical protein